METVYKTEQVAMLSKRLNIDKIVVKRVLDAYYSRLLNRLNSGESIKFLNICYLVNEEDKGGYHETLAYISNDIGTSLKVGKEVVFRVLSELNDCITDDVKNFYSYTIKGLLHISCCEYKTGLYKVRVRKSATLDKRGIRVVTSNSFKRKIENSEVL